MEVESRGLSGEKPRLLKAPCSSAAVLTLSSIAHAQSFGGIHHYELVVLGDEYESDAFNMAYEISDCGLIVGQMKRAVPGVSGLVRQAFIYSTRARPGFSSGTVVFLPSALEPGTPSIARDVNDEGWIVGDFGAVFPESATEARKAVAWRLASTGSLTARPIDPPSDFDFLQYRQGGYGRLTAIASGEAPWVTANFALTELCGLGGAALHRERVVAVQLHAAPTPIVYRLLSGDECPEPDVTDEGRHDAQGISPNGRWLSGSRETCGYSVLCGERFGLKARNWLSDLGACGEPTLGLECVACLTPNPVTIGEFLGAASQSAILDDSSAAGFVADNWEELVGNEPACGARAYVWDPYEPCDWSNPDQPQRRACSTESVPPQSLGAALPLPTGFSVKNSMAHDFERSAFAAQGIVAGHFVAGNLEYINLESDPPTRGHLWFAALGPPDRSRVQAGWDRIPRA